MPTDGDNTVNLNPLENPLSDQEVIALRSTLNPLSDSDLFDLDLYLAVVEFLSQL